MTVENLPRAKRAAAEPATLWEAFAQAQERFGPIVKDTKGARSKYAALDAILDMARPILNECGLILSQPTTVEGDTLFVHTTLIHKATGEMHSCNYPAGAISQQHQLLGAGVTYARRYSLLSILGVFPENEDDDGEKAGAAGGVNPASPPPRQQHSTIRAAAQPFIDKAKGEIAAAEGDVDAALEAFEAIKARPGWKQLTTIEQTAIRNAMPELPQ